MHHQTLPEKKDEVLMKENDGKSKAHVANQEKLSASPLWEEYNEEINKNYLTFRSYTDCYFEWCHLSSYLTTTPKIILQLGAAGGHFLAKQQTEGSQVMGYDYSLAATAMMQQQGIPNRQIDLNQLTADKTNLAYRHILEKDLAEPCNIIAVRVVNYLDLEVANILLNTLIELAQPGSTFFLISRYSENTTEEERLPLHYQATLFAKRADMKIFLQTTSKEVLQQHKKDLEAKVRMGSNAAKDDLVTLEELDDILVVRKLGK